MSSSGRALEGTLHKEPPGLVKESKAWPAWTGARARAADLAPADLVLTGESAAGLLDASAGQNQPKSKS